MRLEVHLPMTCYKRYGYTTTRRKNTQWVKFHKMRVMALYNIKKTVGAQSASTVHFVTKTYNLKKLTQISPSRRTPCHFR